MTNKCEVCGREFEAQKSTKKYCGELCAYAARREREFKKRTTGKKEIEKACLICGQIFSPKTPAANQRSCCYNCMPEGVQLTRSGFLQKIKLKFGGKCVKCGYDKCTQALEFHHIDPSKKDFTISNDNFKLKDAIEEVKKCTLLCSNCHKEFHAGMWDLSEIKIKETEEVEL